MVQNNLSKVSADSGGVELAKVNGRGKGKGAGDAPEEEEAKSKTYDPVPFLSLFRFADTLDVVLICTGLFFAFAAVGHTAHANDCFSENCKIKQLLHLIRRLYSTRCSRSSTILCTLRLALRFYLRQHFQRCLMQRQGKLRSYERRT